MNLSLWLWLMLAMTLSSRACIWDAETLGNEQARSKDLATAILGETPAPDDPAKLRARIADLNAHRNEASAEWWNNLAGAYLRLNQPAKAVKILEPVAKIFTNDYGIHANLGTAYHLLGRYADAEKEIARDLAINPEAHFGLEKYHLALLQYLVRDAKYKSRHVYVDELTAPFLMGDRGRIQTQFANMVADEEKSSLTNGIAEAENALAQRTGTNPPVWDELSFTMLAGVCALDTMPGYRVNWDLADNTNFEAGVIYMAQMNPQEPACATMLGIAAWKERNYNLAVKAFEKAIALNSPQADLLRAKIMGLNDYIKRSLTQSRGLSVALIVLLLCVVTFTGCCILGIVRFVNRNFLTQT